jgi:uncharacterized surface protein with fasciclin (FAS1) repeats
MLHKITTVSALAVFSLMPASLAGQMSEKDIVETAVEAGSFTTLAAALEAADLVSVLQGEGPFTVFAPTDEAFAKLPAGTVEGLLADKEALIKVLTYHVVSGKVMSDAVVNISSAKTVSGIEVPVEVRMGDVFVGGAKVIKADILTSNGVIHVIDTVMLPPAM